MEKDKVTEFYTDLKWVINQLINYADKENWRDELITVNELFRYAKSMDSYLGKYKTELIDIDILIHEYKNTEHCGSGAQMGIALFVLSLIKYLHILVDGYERDKTTC